jgi:hypothetical protein
MSDIVERLRRHYPECWDEAADEIERLHAQRDELLAALRAVVSAYGDEMCDALEIASAAIAKMEGQ